MGQFGLSAIKTLPIKHLTMTDFHHNVINSLNFHIKLNLHSLDDEQYSIERLEVLITFIVAL